MAVVVCLSGAACRTKTSGPLRAPAPAAAEIRAPERPLLEQRAWIARQDSMMRNPKLAAQFNQWLSQFDRLKGRPLYQQALAVDAAVDALVQPVSDSANFGMTDYFSAPAATVMRKSGDCDDYATLKYETMHYLGAPDTRIYVMGVSRRDHLDHAILAIDTSAACDKSGVVVADNLGRLTDGGGRAVSLWKTGYRPYFIVNRSGYSFAGVKP